ncbi:VanZ family protein [Bacillus sp. ISL-41]|uniref:VanZ family protein n=1 Tax=Bacillus sp. ISL-41 TaxID=2819127 RepID=UPI001BEAFF2F|nr:VanZ family protein [Bacillus sp. ISL-41]MBT2642224.1 VanZ family protein [Bacillus sp. ISL-41]
MQNNKIKSVETHSHIVIKIVLVLAWGLILLIQTWTNSLEFLFHFGEVSFNMNASPNYLSFFLNDITSVHPFFILVKFGHYLGFLIMNLLVFHLLRNNTRALIVSIFFAFITEFMQLYFGRDGRFYDFIIDICGIWTAYFIIKLKKK